MDEPVRPDPAAAEIRTTCSRQLVIDLAQRLGIGSANPDVVLKTALDHLPAKGLALWDERA